MPDRDPGALSASVSLHLSDPIAEPMGDGAFGVGVSMKPQRLVLSIDLGDGAPVEGGQIIEAVHHLDCSDIASDAGLIGALMRSFTESTTHADGR